MNRNNKIILLTAVLISACLTAAFIAQLPSTPQPHPKRYEGVSTSIVARGAVDEGLNPYVDLTTALSSGSSGPGYSWNIIYGEVSWIGSPDMSVRSMQNLHLTVYATVDNNQTSGKLTLLQVGIHVVVNQTATPIPQDALSHQEVIIPNLSIENPRYEYHFNCSTYIPPNPTATPTENT